MKRICSWCGRIVDSETHVCENRPKDKRRGRQLSNDSRWSRIRQQVRERDLCCKLCLHEGRFSNGEEVHHIIPREVRDTDDYVWNVNNCIYLCRDCHHRVHNEGWKKYKDLLQQLIK